MEQKTSFKGCIRVSTFVPRQKEPVGIRKGQILPEVSSALAIGVRLTPITAEVYLAEKLAKAFIITISTYSCRDVPLATNGTSIS